jgi:hypothetical protein
MKEHFQRLEHLVAIVGSPTAEGTATDLSYSSSSQHFCHGAWFAHCAYRVAAITMTTTQLPSSDVDSYDYLIAGGGTAGCVIASRLAEYLPHKKILLIEAGPSDFLDDRVLDLKQWLSLLGGELDYDYGTTEQPMGQYDWRALYFIMSLDVARTHSNLLV